MSNEKYFTIIVPVYNAEKYLKRCIDSILEQSFQKFELILIDDGSTDLSRKICEDYALQDERVKVYCTTNEGPFQARKTGLKYAEGKYVLFGDADDYYLNSSCFLNMFKLVEEEKYDFIQFGYYKKYNHLKRAMRTVKENVEVSSFEFYSNDYPILLCNNYRNSRLTGVVWNKIYSRELLKGISDFAVQQRFFMGDDIVFNLCALQRCKKILFTPEIFYVYNDLTGGTTKFRKNEMKDLNVLKECQLVFLNKWIYGNALKIEQSLFGEMAAWFFLFIQQALENMDYNDVELLIKKTLEYSSFKKAKQYYLDHSEEKWTAVELLRKGNVAEYICEAEKVKDAKISLYNKLK